MGKTPRREQGGRLMTVAVCRHCGKGYRSHPLQMNGRRGTHFYEEGKTCEELEAEVRLLREALSPFAELDSAIQGLHYQRAALAFKKTRGVGR